MNIFTYSGRLNRLKYFLYSFGTGIVGAALAFALHAVPVLPGVIFLAATVINSMFTVQRFHDIAKPGWYYWLLLVPFYNIYLFLILLFKKGTVGPNTYGEDPLGSPIVVAV